MNIARKLEERILTIIENLPMGENGKRYLTFNVIVDIFDTYHLINPSCKVEESNITYGITTSEQANRYFENFLSKLDKSKCYGLRKYSNTLRNNSNIYDSLSRIICQLDLINQREREAKICGEKIDNQQWHDIVKQFLEQEKMYLEASISSIDTLSGLTNIILGSLSILQGMTLSIHDDEVSRCSVLNSLIDAKLKNWRCKDESKWGKSPTGLKPGELDIAIESELGTKISIIECFQLECLDRSSIREHVSKIFDYDTGGLKQNYIIIFTKTLKLMELWKKYTNFISSGIGFKYELKSTEDISEAASRYSDILVYKTEHLRNEKTVCLYHIMVHFK